MYAIQNKHDRMKFIVWKHGKLFVSSSELFVFFKEAAENCLCTLENPSDWEIRKLFSDTHEDEKEKEIQIDKSYQNLESRMEVLEEKQIKLQYEIERLHL